MPFLASRRASLSRQTLVAFLAATLVPLAVFAIVSNGSVSQAIHTQQQAALDARSQALVAVFDQKASSAVDRVESLGHSTALCQAIALRRTSSIVSTISAVPRTTNYTGIEVLGRPGRLIASSGVFRGLRLASLTSVKDAAREGKSGWGLQRIGGRLFLVAAAPVVSQGDRRFGVMVLGRPVDDSLLRQLAAATGARSLGLYFGGRLTAASAPALPLALGDGRLGVMSEQGGETVVLVAFANQDGRRQAVVRLALPSRTLSVADSALWRATLWATLAALVMALGVSIGLATYVRRPLKRLVEAARAIAAGDRVGALKASRQDEVGELTVAFNAMNEQIARQLRENAEAYAKLDETYLETVTALAAAMEAKDHYTADHAASLVATTLAVGRRLGLSQEASRELRYAAVLHDIGKIGIPGQILNKPGALTPEEFATMTEHSAIGEQIIARVEHLRPVARVVRSAHERYDGRGYPDGLTGEQISLASRILLVCDAYDAMTSDRPYRKAMSAEAAVTELLQGAGSQFDPRVVDAFVAEYATDGAATLAESSPLACAEAAEVLGRLSPALTMRVEASRQPRPSVS